MNRLHAAIAAVALLCAPTRHAVAGQEPTIDFARHAETYDVTMSPTGDYVAISVPTEDNSETQLKIVPLDGSGKVQVLRFGNQMHVSDVVWSADDQLVVSRAKLEPLKARPVSYGELMTSDISGHNQDTLFAYVPDLGNRRGRRKDQGQAWVEQVLDKEPGKILVGFQCWRSVCGEDPPTSVYKVDTLTGHREQVEHADGLASFGFDRDGRARVKTTYDVDDNPTLQYRPTPASDWVPMPKALAGRSVSSVWFEPDNNTAYMVASDHGEPGQLYKVDFAAGSRTRLLGRDDMEIYDLMYEGRDGPPFAAVYMAGKPTVEYIDSTSAWAQLHLGLMKLFPGQMVTIGNASRDGGKVAFTVWSDRHPWAYYVYDRTAKQVQLVAESMPWFKPAEMAPTRPIAFKARDGRELFGFYTAKGTGPQPMVVMPHGGPHGPYDRWGFDPEVQFLASRGYAVLQVNYRGSGGRGWSFEQAGYGKWGTAIQDDIADGVHWAIDQKLADPDRICTFGASFGGYAALMNPIRNPGLYKCAVGYVGVYDLTVMKKKGDITDTDNGRHYLSRAIGDDPAELVANSPAQQVDKVKVPVMLAAGKDDRRVPMAQFDAMVDAFKATGRPVETLVFAGEGHGFYKPEHRVALYDKLAEFLDTYIGSGKSTASR